MVHFEKTYNQKINESIYQTLVDNAKTSLTLQNGEIDFELTESISNKQLNDNQGTLTKFRILKNSKIIGFLEVFRNYNNLELLIYSTPINN